MSLSLTLHPGKEKLLHQKNRWIFSGALNNPPQEVQGEILPIFSSTGERLGSGTYNSFAKTIQCRVIAWGDEDPYSALENSLDDAIAIRRAIIPEDTNMYRLVHAEADGFPGIVVDIYNDVAVILSATAGGDLLVDWLKDALLKRLPLRAIVLRSDAGCRKEEGLKPLKKVLYGDFSGEVCGKELGLEWIIRPLIDQKSGWFLDQRPARLLVEQYSKDRHVLNLFGYNGGFSLAALKGGAAKATTVDLSFKALEQANYHAELNHLKNHATLHVDIMDWIEEVDRIEENLIICDPPAFAKKRADVVKARKAYYHLHRRLFEKMPRNSMFFTFSCSHLVEMADFMDIIKRAAIHTGRDILVLKEGFSLEDHPKDPYHPFSEYLKSLLFWVK